MLIKFRLWFLIKKVGPIKMETVPFETHSLPSLFFLQRGAVVTKNGVEAVLLCHCF